jgi:hypothetical protein
MNLFQYANQNPLGYTDPTGENPIAIPVLECIANPACVGPLIAFTSKIIEQFAKDAGKAIAKNVDSCGSNDKCEEIRRRINNHVNYMREKRFDLLRDEHKLYKRAYDINPGGDLSGKGTYFGHINRFTGLKKGLARMILEAIANGCYVPPEAYSELIAPTPMMPDIL